MTFLNMANTNGSSSFFLLQAKNIDGSECNFLYKETMNRLHNLTEKVYSHHRHIALTSHIHFQAFYSNKSTSHFPTRYTFYDGPPFATGLPHYGHILAGTIKDVVTRFAHQSGFHVDRRFGWDCHGLPVVRICLSEYCSNHLLLKVWRGLSDVFLGFCFSHSPFFLCRSMRLTRLWGSRGLPMWPRWASLSTTSSAEALS